MVGVAAKPGSGLYKAFVVCRPGPNRPLSTHDRSPPDSGLISDTSWRTAAKTDREIGVKAGKRKEVEMRDVVTVVQWKREHRIPQTQSPRSSLRPPHKLQTKEGMESEEINGAKVRS